MGNYLIAIGAFTWLMFLMITYVFLTAPEKNLIERARQSFKLRLIEITRLEFGISLMKLTGIIWMAVGILLKFTGELLSNEILGDIILGAVILTPVWVGAIIAEWRKGKGI